MDRIISDEPRFLNLIDSFVPKEGLGKIAVSFSKDLMRDVRNHENIISSLGFIIRVNALDAILKTVIGA